MEELVDDAVWCSKLETLKRAGGLLLSEQSEEELSRKIQDNEGQLVVLVGLLRGNNVFDSCYFIGAEFIFGRISASFCELYLAMSVVDDINDTKILRNFNRACFDGWKSKEDEVVGFFGNEVVDTWCTSDSGTGNYVLLMKVLKRLEMWEDYRESFPKARKVALEKTQQLVHSYAEGSIKSSLKGLREREAVFDEFGTLPSFDLERIFLQEISCVVRGLLKLKPDDPQDE